MAWNWTFISTLLLSESFSSTELINNPYEPTAVSSEELSYKRCEWMDSVHWSWADAYIGRRKRWGGQETNRTNIDLDIAGRVPRKITDEKRLNVNKVLKMRSLSSIPYVEKLIKRFGKFGRFADQFPFRQIREQHSFQKERKQELGDA